MKIFAIILLSYFSTTIADICDNCASSPEMKNTSLQEDPVRDKRTLGIDKNIKKEIELKTKLGTVLKVSKSITYNDGGGLILLPALLKSIAIKKHLLSKLKSTHHLKHTPNIHPQHHEKDDYVVGATYAESEPTRNKPVNIDHAKTHRHDHLNKHKKLLKLKKNLFIKKMSDIVRVLASHKKVGPPCCPNGPCCPGNQG